MKKSIRFVSVLLIVFMVVGLSGCGKKNPLIGVWTVEKSQNNSTTKGENIVIEMLQKTNYADGTRIEFKEEGEYVLEAENLNWKIEEDMLILTNSNGKTSNNKYYLNGKKLTVEFMDGKFVVEFTKSDEK